MPTGGGKTICYAVPAVMENKVAVVVFPLLALLLDQAERLRSKGLKVCYLMMDMEETERENIMHKLNSNSPEYNFFFVTPETVLAPGIMAILESLSGKDLLSLIVIDEAHCIDMWGFHFRPSYLELWKLCNLGCPLLAMTGTATPRTQKVILDCLKLSKDAMVIRQPSNRPNLIYHVDKKMNCDGITSLIKEKFPNQCGIIYCVERKDTVDVTYHLKRAGINAMFYHAGMDVHEKQATVDSWRSGSANIICATVAFGMGIDRPDVRFVIHHSMPKDLESYVQESGRAGRDGSEAHCFIFFRFEDRTKHLRNICTLPDTADTDRRQISLDGLNDIVKYCIIPICRKQQIANYFDHEIASSDICNKSCDICLMNKRFAPIDCSKDANELLNCLDEMQKIQQKVTTKLLALTYRGSKSAVITKKGLQNASSYGRGKNKFNDRDLNRFIQCMIIERILEEQLPQASENRSTSYVCQGTNANKLKENIIVFTYFKL